MVGIGATMAVSIWAWQQPEKPDCLKPQHGTVLAKVYVMGGRPEFDRYSIEIQNKDCTVSRLIPKDKWDQVSVGGEATF